MSTRFARHIRDCSLQANFMVLMCERRFALQAEMEKTTRMSSGFPLERRYPLWFFPKTILT